jgi:SAM-dependent methyltransferase
MAGRSLWRRAEGKIRREFRRRFPTAEQKRHSLVGPASAWKEKRDVQIAFLQTRGLAPSNQFIDIGCGTLRGGIPIIDYLAAGNYTGVDVRTEVEPEARAELAKHALDSKQPHLHFGVDLATFDLDQAFDVAWAYAVLFHLSDERLAECLAFVRAHLAPGGAFYANVKLGEHPPDQWREFPLIWRSMDAYRAAAATAQLSIEDLGSVRDLGYDLSLGAEDRMCCFR